MIENRINVLCSFSCILICEIIQIPLEKNWANKISFDSFVPQNSQIQFHLMIMGQMNERHFHHKSKKLKKKRNFKWPAKEKKPQLF